MSTATSNGRTVNVEQASLKTATITIQAMTVDKRQVTQSVFRQLLEEPVVDAAGIFKGVPWGTVNYCPRKPCVIGKHLHVVWQKGSELRRASARPPEAKFEPWIDNEDCDPWLLLALNGGWWPKTWERKASCQRRSCLVEFVGDLPPIECRMPGEDEREALEHLIGLREHGERPDSGETWRQAQWDTTHGQMQKLCDRIEKLRTEATREERDRQIKDEIIGQHRAWEESWARWREIQALPQLFIAT